MLFNSYTFIFVFLPITFFGFAWMTQLNRRVAICWLVACSLFYYGWWNPAYLGLILASMIGNYAIGCLLTRINRAGPSRGVLAFGVAANLCALGYFKYAGFFVGILTTLFDQSWRIGDIALPLAISFFTFQQIAYLVDAYRGLAREYDFIDYALFVTFFPQLIAGPIVHHGEMLPQFRQQQFRINSRDASIGLTMFVIGLFKKVVLADTFATFATGTFDAAAQGVTPDMQASVVATLAYTLQLYFDFSGYSDMAIGAARLFQIRLPINFDSPYKAVSVSDFWRRWHLTLSRFLRDYLYFPLGGNRKGPVRRYVNLALVMLLGGLWHGAGWTFVVWGGLHGIYLVVNHAWSAARKQVLGVRGSSRTERAAYRVLTFVAVVFAWIFFRAEGFDAAWRMIRGVAGLNGWGWSTLSPLTLAWILLGLGVVWLCPNSQQLLTRYSPVLLAQKPGRRLGWCKVCFSWLGWRPSFGWALVVAVITILDIIHLSRVSEFIYYQF